VEFDTDHLPYIESLTKAGKEIPEPSTPSPADVASSRPSIMMPGGISPHGMSLHMSPHGIPMNFGPAFSMMQGYLPGCHPMAHPQVYPWGYPGTFGVMGGFLPPPFPVAQGTQGESGPLSTHGEPDQKKNAVDGDINSDDARKSAHETATSRSQSSVESQ